MSFSVIGRTGIVADRISKPEISFSSIGNTSVTVSWTSQSNATSYLLQRSTSLDFSQNLTTVYTGPLLTTTDSGLSINTQYYYRVKARGAGFIDSLFDSDSITTTGGGAQLSTPTVTRLGYGRNSISVTWPEISNATGYVVQRATDSGFSSNLTEIFNGDAEDVIREFQPGYMLEYHDSGLTAGTTYYYRVKATGPGFSDSNWGTKQIATGAAYKTATVTGPTHVSNNIDGSSNPFQWWDGSQVQNIHGGDTVALSGTAWQYMVLQNFHGTPTEPLTIRNQGQVSMSAGFSLETCSYIHITGSHVSKSNTRGIEIFSSGGGICVEIFGLSHHLEIDNILTDHGAYALRLKNEINTFASEGDCGAEYWWPSHMHDIHIHDWDCTEHFQDGFYIGSSGPWDGMRTMGCNGDTISPRPTGLANIEVNNINMSYCGRSGFQMGCLDDGTNLFHDNIITECGFEYAADQGAGMAIGGATNSIEVYNNTITRTYREGIYTYGFGLQHYHDNTFDEIGTISVDPDREIFWLKINLNPGQTVSPAWTAANQGRVVRVNNYSFEFFVDDGLGNPIVKAQRYLPYPINSAANEIATLDTALIGSGAGTHNDPYTGFGASSAIDESQVELLTETSIPSGVGNFMVNTFSSDSTRVYGTPDGLTTVLLENNSFGSQTAASNQVVKFLASVSGHYTDANELCGNTYLGSNLVSGNINNPAGISYSLNTSC